MSLGQKLMPTSPSRESSMAPGNDGNGEAEFVEWTPEEGWEFAWLGPFALILHAIGPPAPGLGGRPAPPCASLPPWPQRPAAIATMPPAPPEAEPMPVMPAKGS
eukprot:4154193-Pleurochrysis_carterae.AAC.3